MSTNSRSTEITNNDEHSKHKQNPNIRVMVSSSVLQFLALCFISYGAYSIENRVMNKINKYKYEQFAGFYDIVNYTDLFILQSEAVSFWTCCSMEFTKYGDCFGEICPYNYSTSDNYCKLSCNITRHTTNKYISNNTPPLHTCLTNMVSKLTRLD